MAIRNNRTKFSYLKIMVLLLLAGNLLGIYKGLFLKESLADTYAKIPLSFREFLILIPILSIIALIAIWQNKRWGFYLITGITVLVLFIDIYSEFWMHAFAAGVSYLLLYLGYHYDKTRELQ